MTVRVRAGHDRAPSSTTRSASTGSASPCPRSTARPSAACWRSGTAASAGCGGARPRHVLEVRFVTADGASCKGGGPTVKNVSGYDLPRLLVGSLGTLGFIGEVVLRTRPVPRCRAVVRAATPTRSRSLRRLHRPAVILWDGTTTWLLLEGHAPMSTPQRRAAGLAEADGRRHRWPRCRIAGRCRPSRARSLRVRRARAVSRRGRRRHRPSRRSPATPPSRPGRRRAPHARMKDALRPDRSGSTPGRVECVAR